MIRLTVSRKLAIAIGIPLCLGVAMALISYAHVRHIERGLKHLVEVDQPMGAAAYEVEINTLESGFAALAYSHDRNPACLTRIGVDYEEFRLALGQMKDLAENDRQRGQMQRLGQLFTAYQQHAGRSLADADALSNKTEQFQRVLDEIDVILDERLQAAVMPQDPQAVEKLRATIEMEINVNGIAKVVRRNFAQQSAKSAEHIGKAEGEFREFLGSYRKLTLSGEASQQVDAVEVAFDRAVRLAREVVALQESRRGQIDAMITVREELDDLVDDEIQPPLLGAAAENLTAMYQVATEARLLTLGAVAISLLVGGGGGLLIVRGFRESVGRLVDAANAFGRGVLEHRLEVRSSDEMHDIADAFNEMVLQVRGAHAALSNVNLELERRVADRTAELTQRNEELEQFAYVASHDLQEPLRKVVSCCQVLTADHADQLDDEARQWLEFAVGGALRMQNLIADLLCYSRLGRSERPLTAVDAQAACRAALENLQVAIEESAAQVTCHPLPRVLAEETQLVQLFQNLIGNAIKYQGDAPPRIEVGIRPERSLAEPAGNSPASRSYVFYVRDNGIGIQPKYFQRIFVIFQRLHRKDEYSGTGIGLALCKKIVERHDGRIWVESTPSAGSTFLFTLPAAVADATFDTAATGRGGDDSLLSTPAQE